MKSMHPSSSFLTSFRQLEEICKFCIQRHGFLLRPDLEQNFIQQILNKHSEAEMKKRTCYET